jgi:glycosyltransferase involved in cell wall biosynthesis
MVHEPFLPFREGTWKQDAAAIAHRLMTIILLNAVRRVWTSIPAWESRLRPYALGRIIKFGWLPIPSTIPVIDDPLTVAALRTRYAPAGNILIAHFGTYGRHITEPLKALLVAILRDHTNISVLLLGRGGEALRDDLIGVNGMPADRVHATGQLAAADLSRHLSACDFMIQPYPDGISSRRTSAMAGLSHGLAIVTTTGHNTESFWAESGAVAISSDYLRTPMKEIA